MKRPWWNPRFGVVTFSLVLLVLHGGLKEVMSRHDVISSLFAAGTHVPGWMLALTFFCALVRASLFLLLPPMLAYHLSQKMLQRGHRR